MEASASWQESAAPSDELAEEIIREGPAIAPNAARLLVGGSGLMHEVGGARGAAADLLASGMGGPAPPGPFPGAQAGQG